MGSLSNPNNNTGLTVKSLEFPQNGLKNTNIVGPFPNRSAGHREAYPPTRRPWTKPHAFALAHGEGGASIWFGCLIFSPSYSKDIDGTGSSMKAANPKVYYPSNLNADKLLQTHLGWYGDVYLYWEVMRDELSDPEEGVPGLWAVSLCEIRGPDQPEGMEVTAQNMDDPTLVGKYWLKLGKVDDLQPVNQIISSDFHWSPQLPPSGGGTAKHPFMLKTRLDSGIPKYTITKGSIQDGTNGAAVDLTGIIETETVAIAGYVVIQADVAADLTLSGWSTTVVSGSTDAAEVRLTTTGEIRQDKLRLLIGKITLGTGSAPTAWQALYTSVRIINMMHNGVPCIGFESAPTVATAI